MKNLKSICQSPVYVDHISTVARLKGIPKKDYEYVKGEMRRSFFILGISPHRIASMRRKAIRNQSEMWDFSRKFSNEAIF